MTAKMIICICIFTHIFMNFCMYVSVDSETDTPGGTAGGVGDGDAGEGVGKEIIGNFPDKWSKVPIHAGEGVGEESVGNFPDKWSKAPISIRMRNSDIKNDSSPYGINSSFQNSILIEKNRPVLHISQYTIHKCIYVCLNTYFHFYKFTANSIHRNSTESNETP
jgi:hypothetical protein